jgi:hypothetical protein
MRSHFQRDKSLSHGFKLYPHRFVKGTHKRKTDKRAPDIDKVSGTSKQELEPVSAKVPDTLPEKGERGGCPINDPTVAKDLNSGALVRYVGRNPDWQKYQRNTMVVLGVATRSGGSPDFDMIRCQLPDGGTNDFLRNTLQRV